MVRTNKVSKVLKRLKLKSSKLSIPDQVITEYLKNIRQACGEGNDPIKFSSQIVRFNKGVLLQLEIDMNDTDTFHKKIYQINELKNIVGTDVRETLAKINVDIYNLDCAPTFSIKDKLYIVKPYSLQYWGDQVFTDVKEMKEYILETVELKQLEEDTTGLVTHFAGHLTKLIHEDDGDCYRRVEFNAVKFESSVLLETQFFLLDVAEVPAVPRVNLFEATSLIDAWKFVHVDFEKNFPEQTKHDLLRISKNYKEYIFTANTAPDEKKIIFFQICGKDIWNWTKSAANKYFQRIKEELDKPLNLDASLRDKRMARRRSNRTKADSNNQFTVGLISEYADHFLEALYDEVLKQDTIISIKAAEFNYGVILKLDMKKGNRGEQNKSDLECKPIKCELVETISEAFELMKINPIEDMDEDEWEDYQESVLLCKPFFTGTEIFFCEDCMYIIKEKISYLWDSEAAEDDCEMLIEDIKRFLENEKDQE
jgi:hypothetical protein